MSRLVDQAAPLRGLIEAEPRALQRCRDGKHKTCEEVLQLRALMQSDRWEPAIQRALRPLAKPVPIAGTFGARAAA
jgi:hypothetical protein